MTEGDEMKIYPSIQNGLSIGTPKKAMTACKFEKEHEQHQDTETDQKVQRRRISMSGKLSRIAKRQYNLSRYRSDATSDITKANKSISSLPDEGRPDLEKGDFAGNRLSTELSDLVDQLCTKEYIYPPLSILLDILFERGPSTIGIFRKSSNCRQVDNILSGLITIVHSEVGKSDITVSLEKQVSLTSIEEFKKIRDPHLAVAIFKRLLQASRRPFFSTVICTKWIEACGCVLPDHIKAYGVAHEEHEQQSTKYRRASKALFLINRNSVISALTNNIGITKDEAGVTSSQTENANCFREQAIADIWSKRCTRSPAMYSIAKNAIDQLSPGRLLLFRFLVSILYAIQSCQSENNMDFDALAICTSNVLFEQNCKVISLANACILSQAASSFVSFVLRNCVDLFGKRITSCFVDEKFRLRREHAACATFLPHIEKAQLSNEEIISDNRGDPDKITTVNFMDGSCSHAKFKINQLGRGLHTGVDINAELPSTSRSRRTFALNREIWEVKPISDQHNRSTRSGQSIVKVESENTENLVRKHNAHSDDDTQRLLCFLNSQSDNIDNTNSTECILSTQTKESTNSVDLRPNSGRKGFTGWLKSVYLRSNLVNVHTNGANKYLLYSRRQSCKRRLREEEKFQATMYIGGTTLNQIKPPSAEFNDLNIAKAEVQRETTWKLIENKQLSSSVHEDHDRKLYVENSTSHDCSLINYQIPASLRNQYDNLIPSIVAKHYNQNVLSTNDIFTDYITNNGNTSCNKKDISYQRDACLITTVNAATKQSGANTRQLCRRFSTPNKVIKENDARIAENNINRGGNYYTTNGIKPVIPAYVYRHLLKTTNSEVYNTSNKKDLINKGNFANEWLRTRNNHTIESNMPRPLQSTPVKKLINGYDDCEASRFLKHLQKEDVRHISSNVFKLESQGDMTQSIPNANLTVNTLRTIYVNL